jgi:hypothetical protein
LFESRSSPVRVSFPIVVVASVEVPVTTKVLVVVLFVVVKLVMNAVKALKRDAKKLDEVAFVVDAFVEKKFVAVALVEKKLVAVRAADEALPRAV